MDHESFDKIARLLGAAGSRRAALGALLGAGALGATEAIAAKKNRKNRKSRKSGRGGVSAQAVCAPPANGVNRNNCTYDGDDFSGQLIHSSSYKNTTWVDATLVETDLHSSNFRGGSFLRANLCGAKLHSSTLTNVNFENANLALADLHSSACGGATFNAGTFWCNTIDCNGDLRNDDCPGGLPSNLCCTPCGPNDACVNNRCVPCTQWILSGGANPAAPISVDDDLLVELNGSEIFADQDGSATDNPPIAFAAAVGDSLRVVARDEQQPCRSLSPLWLHCPASGRSRQLFDGVNDGCAGNPVPTDFVDETFIVTL